MRQTAAAALMVLALAACAVGPDYRRPDIDVPAEPRADEARAAQWAEWWRQFDDPVLTGLVALALENNLDMRMALVRVAQARAAYGLSDADRMPELSAQAAAGRERTRNPSLTSGNGHSTFNSFSVVGQLSYEVDLWGRLAREREATLARLAESTYAADALGLALVAEVVNTYVQLRASEDQHRITQQAIKVRQDAVEFETARYQVGETNELVLRQAESQLAAARARLPVVERQTSIARNALAILTGRSPNALLELDTIEGPALTEIHVPRILPETLPLNLLERRPDLRAAEAALVAANAGVGLAEAARLPGLSLSALLGKSSDQASDLFDTPRIWSVGASLFGPVLDFGRNRARVEQALALREAAELHWRQSALVAYGEVRDAIVGFQTAGERVVAIEQQIRALRRVNDLAEIRHREGLVSHIEKLDADRGLLEARLQLSGARADWLTAAATLFKAIGGGWTESGNSRDAD